jgi:hypothetical protein
LTAPKTVKSAGVHFALDRPLPWGWVDVPMLFRPNMVDRLLVDEKRETRRLRGLEKMNRRPDFVKLVELRDVPKQGVIATFVSTWSGRFYWAKCPYGRPGDRIWVRETWGTTAAGKVILKAHYEADVVAKGFKGYVQPVEKWRPSIHMPRTAAGILLRIQEIRVERLSMLTEAGAIAEGVKEFKFPDDHGYGLPGEPALTRRPKARDFFMHKIWDKIHDEDGLGCAANPWVWVVKFYPVEDDGIPRMKGKAGKRT